MAENNLDQPQAYQPEDNPRPALLATGLLIAGLLLEACGAVGGYPVPELVRPLEQAGIVSWAVAAGIGPN